MNWLFINLVRSGYIQYESLINGTLILWDVLKLVSLYEYDEEIRYIVKDYQNQEIEKQNSKRNHKR
jgi:hypothetical protein